MIAIAIVQLGVEGSEYTLPRLTFIGSPPSWPVSSNKQMEKAVMSDGSFIWAFFPRARIFTVELTYLSAAWLIIMKDLNGLNQILRFKNKNEEDVWYDVVITSFDHEPERMDIRQLERYRVRMTLEEAV